MIQPLLGTLGGCVGCQAGVELVQRRLGGDLNLLTFATFVFVASEGLITQSKFFTVKNVIPLRSYTKLVALFFLVNVLNNYAMKFDIYFPLFIIFKSSSLLAHLVLRSYIQKCTYTFYQIASVLTVSVGIVIFTLASYEPRSSTTAQNYHEFFHLLSFAPFWIGIIFLSFAVILSSYLGICQEQLYARYGKHHKEAMFYVHLLSIPAFVLLGSDLSEAIGAANRTENFEFGGFGIPVPAAWVYIASVSVFQWFCVNNVYHLTAVTSSLNVNMIISVRKFISLFISFVIFGNPFNAFHLFGALIVFAGTLFYAKAF